MAQTTNKDKKDATQANTGTEDDNIPRPVVEAMAKHVSEGTLGQVIDDARSANPDPLSEVASALVPVAKGASVIELRKVVVRNAPPHEDMEARKLYVAQLRRMRDAADTALTLAIELASGV